MEDRQTRVLKKLAKVSGIDETKLMEAFSKIDKEEPVEQPNPTQDGKVDDKTAEPNKGEDNKTPNVDDGKAKVDEPQKTENPIPPKEDAAVGVSAQITALQNEVNGLKEVVQSYKAQLNQVTDNVNKLGITDFDTTKIGGAAVAMSNNPIDDDYDLVKKLGG